MYNFFFYKGLINRPGCGCAFYWMRCNYALFFSMSLSMTSISSFFSFARPQKGKGNVEEFVAELKSSLLAESECSALSIFSICHTAKPLLKELWRVWRPQLPTIWSGVPSYCSPCSFCMSSTNFPLTLGPSIDKKTMFWSLSSFVHSWNAQTWKYNIKKSIFISNTIIGTSLN